jgi:hypothetical protein
MHRLDERGHPAAARCVSRKPSPPASRHRLRRHRATPLSPSLLIPFQLERADGELSLVALFALLGHWRRVLSPLRIASPSRSRVRTPIRGPARRSKQVKIFGGSP